MIFDTAFISCSFSLLVLTLKHSGCRQTNIKKNWLLCWQTCIYKSHSNIYLQKGKMTEGKYGIGHRAGCTKSCFFLNYHQVYQEFLLCLVVLNSVDTDNGPEELKWSIQQLLSFYTNFFFFFSLFHFEISIQLFHDFMWLQLAVLFMLLINLTCFVDTAFITGNPKETIICCFNKMHYSLIH